MKKKGKKADHVETLVQFQSVLLTLDNGKSQWFTGPVFVEEGTQAKVVRVQFTPPRIMPKGYAFENVPIMRSQR